MIISLSSKKSDWRFSLPFSRFSPTLRPFSLTKAERLSWIPLARWACQNRKYTFTYVSPCLCSEKRQRSRHDKLQRKLYQIIE